MALLTFNADSPEVSATGMTKSGSTYVLDGSSGVVTIEADFGTGKAADFSTSAESLSGAGLTEVSGNGSITSSGEDAEITTPSSAQGLLSSIGTMNGTPYVLGKEVTGDFDIEWEIDVNDQVANMVGIQYGDETNYVGIYTVNGNAHKTSKWVNGTRTNTTGLTLEATSGFYRLTRIGDTFTGYFKKLAGDAWSSTGIVGQAYPSTGRVFGASDYRVSQSTSSFKLLGSQGDAPTATYQTTDDTPPTNYVPATPESLAALRARTNTDLQLTTYKVYVDGEALGVWEEFSTEDQTLDVTPPGVPTITNLESVGTDPNLGFFSDWTEPTDTDFNHVRGQLNIDGAGYLDIDDTASLGGETVMKFGEYKAGTQTQEAGWLYQNHYARNGYNEGQTAQVRYRSVDDAGNESAYSTSGIITMQTGSSAPPTPAITDITPGDQKLTITVAAGDETLKVFALYKQTNKSAAWSAESATFSRTGSGDIDIDVLSNGTAYDVITYHKDSGLTCIGQPSNIYSGYPDSDPNGQYRHDRKIYQRDQGALSLLQVAKDQGELMTFRNEGTGTDGVTVYGTIAGEFSRNIGIRNGAVDLQEIVLSVPRQTNFPPDNFDLNGTIEVDGEEFQIQDYTCNPNVKTYAWEFLLNCASVRGQEGY